MMLKEVIESINMQRFPLPMKFLLDEYYGTLALEMKVIHKYGNEPRVIYFHFPLSVGWNRLNVPVEEQKKALTRQLYMFCRQAVLHEIAECFEVNGEVFDNPHANVAPGILREEFEKAPVRDMVFNWKGLV